ncbi:Fido domain [Plasmopara halstedii]|uniref:Fido domain n=1 Tax=Plasmopara halstedii TaxID=4781 RepID=A0A0N7L837_PLAHL|nr:Fido domain [Plasmopara halstedii]CEG48787.1 Fido domain [Plasmopara halstedii]|eukprot:XP_024585156.1 Fido domain [Plasmopara halstedii]
MNERIHATSKVITQKQLVALHERHLFTLSGQAGVFRTDLAVGYRIYRNFLSEKIDITGKNSTERLMTKRRQTQRSLEERIHPFIEENGRGALLINRLSTFVPSCR